MDLTPEPEVPPLRRTGLSLSLFFFFLLMCLSVCLPLSSLSPLFPGNVLE